MGKHSVSPWSMLSILGGIVAMVSVFVPYVWLDFVTNDIGSYIMTTSGFTGLEVVQRELSINSLVLEESNFSMMCYLPAVTALFGAGCSVMGLLTMTVGCRRCSIFTLILSIFGLLSALGFTLLARGEGMFDGGMKDIVAGLMEAGRLSFKAGVGQYIAIGGMGVSFFGCLMSTNKVIN